MISFLSVAALRLPNDEMTVASRLMRSSSSRLIHSFRIGRLSIMLLRISTAGAAGALRLVVVFGCNCLNAKKLEKGNFIILSYVNFGVERIDGYCGGWIHAVSWRAY